MPKTVIKASGPGDFIPHVPALLGYEPERSVLLIPFASNRTLGVLRADIPEAGTEKGVASALIGMVARVNRADGIGVVIYSEEDTSAIADALDEAARQAGFPVQMNLHVSSAGWTVHGSTAAPQPVPAPNAELPKPAPSLAATLEFPDPDPEFVAALTADAVTLFGKGNINDLTEQVVTGDFDPAAVLYILHAPCDRLPALIQWASDLPTGRAATLSKMTVKRPFPADVAIYNGEAGDPSGDRLKTALGVVLRLATSAQANGLHDHAASAFASASWLAWALGRSSMALRCAHTALAQAPSDITAGMVLTFVNDNRLPAWAYNAR